jgi:hypothetical protein
MDELDDSLRALYERVDRISNADERRRVAMRIAAAVNALAARVGPVPVPPTGAVSPSCPHCGLAVTVTLS